MRTTVPILTAALLLGAALPAFGQSAHQSTTSLERTGGQTVSPSAPEIHNPGVNPNAAGTQRGWRGWGASEARSQAQAGGAGSTQPTPASLDAAQARQRLQQLGYRNIAGLSRTETGWTATAVKNHRQVRVALDRNGNLARGR